MFSGFSAARFQLGSFARSSGVLAESLRNLLCLFTGRSPQRITLNKLVIPSLPVCGWGELAASMQDASKIFRDFSSPVQRLLETKGVQANKTAAPAEVFHPSLFSFLLLQQPMAGKEVHGVAAADAGSCRVCKEDLCLSPSRIRCKLMPLFPW